MCDKWTQRTVKKAKLKAQVSAPLCI